MRLRQVTWFTVCVLAGLMAAGGCGHGVQPLWSQAKPETVVIVNPWSKSITVHNSTDTNVTLDEFSGKTAAGTEWTVKNLQFIANASAVRGANVAQLELSRDITDAVMAGVARWINESLAPVRGASATIETPIGSGAIQAGGGAATPAPAIDEAAMRRIIRSEIENTQPAAPNAGG